MSYCRWSSDDFGCDLYVYEAEDGIAIHVASRRVLGEVPKIDWSSGESLFTTYKVQMEFMETAERESIGLPYDGESFYGMSHEEAITWLEELKEVGYKFPQDVIEALKEELKSEET